MTRGQRCQMFPRAPCPAASPFGVTTPGRSVARIPCVCFATLCAKDDDRSAGLPASARRRRSRFSVAAATQKQPGGCRPSVLGRSDGHPASQQVYLFLSTPDFAHGSNPCVFRALRAGTGSGIRDHWCAITPAAGETDSRTMTGANKAGRFAAPEPSPARSQKRLTATRELQRMAQRVDAPSHTAIIAHP